MNLESVSIHSESSSSEVDETLTLMVRIIQTCAAEHFYRYDLNNVASDLEDIIERERERSQPR